MSRPIEQFKSRLDKATSDRGPNGVPNVAVLAADANGTILHTISSGTHLPHAKNPTRNGTDRQPFTADTVCWIASCTKMMTTVAVMQCVERKILSLDEPVEDTWLPEFKDMPIVVDIGPDGPKTRPAKIKVTLRHLLTHTSGIAYEFTHPKLAVWREWSNQTKEGREKQRSKDIASACHVPLLFEPGEGWVYGYGIDWAGLAVMRATSQNLEEYFTENIWRPLGMKSTTFSLRDHRPELYSRLAGMMERNGDGQLEDSDGGIFYKGIEDSYKYGGGGGCFSTANDYIRFLTSLLNTITSAPNPVPALLQPTTLREMFTPTHLSTSSNTQLQDMIKQPLAYGLAGNLGGQPTTFALGGIVNLEQTKPAGRARGGMQWSGLPNLFWWISPGDGVCGLYFGQVLPPGDLRSWDLYGQFEKAVLEEQRMMAAGKGKL